MAKKKLNSNLFTALLYIVVGILLAVFPGEALDLGIKIVGVIFIIFGTLELVKKNWFGGAVSLVVGILILFIGSTLLWIIMLVLGILVAVKGIISLVDALRRSRKSAIEIFFAVLTIVIGILLIFGDMAPLIITIGGILLIVNGIIGLIGCLKK